MDEDDLIALIDLDGSVADYDTAMREQLELLRSPGEEPYISSPAGGEPPHIERRRKLIQNQPGFWRNLQPLPIGFVVLTQLRLQSFGLHVLTKGPYRSPNAWAEKVEWCQERIGDASVAVTQRKDLVYGRILYDDWPPFFLPWLKYRPRGLVITLAQPWNAAYAKGGAEEHPQVFRFDGENLEELRERIRLAKMGIVPKKRA